MLKMLTANKGLLLTRLVRIAVGIGLVLYVAGAIDRMNSDGAKIPKPAELIIRP